MVQRQRAVVVDAAAVPAVTSGRNGRRSRLAASAIRAVGCVATRQCQGPERRLRTLVWVLADSIAWRSEQLAPPVSEKVLTVIAASAAPTPTAPEKTIRAAKTSASRCGMFLFTASQPRRPQTQLRDDPM